MNCLLFLQYGLRDEAVSNFPYAVSQIRQLPEYTQVLVSNTCDLVLSAHLVAVGTLFDTCDLLSNASVTCQFNVLSQKQHPELLSQKQHPDLLITITYHQTSLEKIRYWSIEPKFALIVPQFLWIRSLAILVRYQDGAFQVTTFASPSAWRAFPLTSIALAIDDLAWMSAVFLLIFPGPQIYVWRFVFR